MRAFLLLLFCAASAGAMDSVGLPVPENGAAQTLYFFSPAPRKPGARKKPLVVVLHGGNGDMSAEKARTTAQRYLKVWRPYQEQVVAVAPSSTYGWGFNGYATMRAAIRYAVEHLDADEDRVFLWGQSMGGHGAWRYGVWTPDRFAGIVPICGGYDWQDTFKTVVDLPVYHIQGDKDESYTLKADALKTAEWFRGQKARKAGPYDYTFKLLHGGHELFESEIPKILKWMKGKRRVENPSRINLMGLASVLGWRPDLIPGVVGVDEAPSAPKSLKPLSFAKAYWIETLALKKNDRTVLTSLEAVKTRTAVQLRVDLTTKNVRTVRLELMGDEAKLPSVVVIANGKPAQQSRVDVAHIDVSILD